MSDLEPAMTRLPYPKSIFARKSQMVQKSLRFPPPATITIKRFEAASLCISLPNQEISVIRFPNRRIEPALLPAAGRQERNAIVAF
jgi:hypothetical protein